MFRFALLFSSANPLMYRSKIGHLPPWTRSNAFFHSLNGRNNLFTGVQKQPSIIPKFSYGNTHNCPTSSFHAYVMRRGPLISTSRSFSSSIRKPSHPRKSAKNIATFKSVSPPQCTLYVPAHCCVVCVSLE